MSRERVVAGKAAADAAAEAAANVEELEILQGRRAPYSQQPDWVSLADIKHASVRLYSLLAAHVNTRRRREEGNREVWPTMEDLAVMLGYSRRDKVAPFRDDLVRIGAIEVEQVPVPGGGNRTRSKYTVHETPPVGYAGPESLQEFYADLRAKRAAERAAKQAEADDENIEPAGEPRSPVSGTGPVPQMGDGSGTSNEVRNKTKELDEGNADGGGNPPPPPNPPADLTAGGVPAVPPSVVGSSGDQQTARVPSLRRPVRRPTAPAGGVLRARYEAERRAAAACPHCDDAGLTPGGASCPHETHHNPPRHGPDSTLTDDPVSAR